MSLGRLFLGSYPYLEESDQAVDASRTHVAPRQSSPTNAHGTTLVAEDDESGFLWDSSVLVQRRGVIHLVDEEF